MEKIDGPNRQSGSWLPGVTRCNNRVMPCGNPRCADEAMRAAQIEAGAGGETCQSAYAMSHALKIAAQCAGDCPLGDEERPRHEALKVLKTRHAKGTR